MNNFEAIKTKEFKNSLLISFTEEQADFIVEQKLLADQRAENGENLRTDYFEDEMWFTFNQSGLFEDMLWEPSFTRLYITEDKL